MPQGYTCTSLSYLQYLLLVSSCLNTSLYAVQAAPSHKEQQQQQSPLHAIVIGNTKDGAGHIQIARNHAAQVKRKRDPEALLNWADVQVRKMKSRYRSGRKRKRDRKEDHTAERPKTMAKRQNQQGYEELHNLFSDTEVGSINVFTFPLS